MKKTDKKATAAPCATCVKMGAEIARLDGALRAKNFQLGQAELKLRRLEGAINRAKQSRLIGIKACIDAADPKHAMFVAKDTMRFLYDMAAGTQWGPLHEAYGEVESVGNTLTIKDPGGTETR